MQGLQGDLLIVVIIAAAAFLAGLCGERLRAKLARQAWQKRGWRKGERGVSFKTGAAPVTDPAEQLRLVMGARFEKRRLLSRSEAHVLYAAEREINAADLKWRVMAQVSLGEVLSSPDARAYSAINSKRVDLLIVSRSGDPIAAIEYQGHSHYRGTAAARDAVKKEALRKAGVRYIAVTPSLVRFTPVSDRRADIRNRQLRAKSRLMHRSKKTSYSITLSASPRSVGGTVKPRPVAAFKLITISNLTGA
jgi:Protein of unknown function (DUF2726)